MERSRFLLFAAAVVILFFFLNGCRKNQPYQTSHETTFFQQTISELRRAFDSAGYAQHLTEKYLTDRSVRWDPDWEAASQAVMGKKVIYYYIPLKPTILETNTGKVTGSLNLFGYRNFMLIRKTETATEFTRALYISDSTRGRAVTDKVFFNGFSGTMNVLSLSKGTFHQYKYSLGSAAGPRPPEKIIVDGYVTECKTLYICQWGALCGGDTNNYYSTVTESYDGCTSPTDGPICDGEYLQYQYVSSTTQQDCQQVWVDDPPPPPPGGGGSSVTTIVNNIQNSALKKVFAAIGNPKLINTIESILQEFGTTQKLTYTFSDDYTGADPAKTTPVKQADGTITGYNIQLNAAKIGGYSQEAITEIIDHEIMHAFINDPSITVSQQHDIMLTTFLGDLVSANEQVNPGLTGRDATALALYGVSSLNYFDETAPNFQAALSANNLTLGDINSIYQAYTIGINGVISGHQPH